MTAVSTATRRAERFFAEVADEFGIRSGEIVTIPMRQCELARRKALAASTVAAHVRAMGERVLQRCPVIVITDHRTCAGATSPEAPAEHEGDLVSALNDVVRAQQRLIDLLMSSATTPLRIVAENRGIVAIPDVERTSRTPESKEEPSFLPREKEIRDGCRGSVADLATAAGSHGAWSTADLDRVLAPLHDAVRERGLKAMNNRAVLANAVETLDLAQIEAAVQRLIPMTNSGSVTSPFGLLVSWARRGQSHTFAIPVPVLPVPSAPPSSALHPDLVVVVEPGRAMVQRAH